MEDPANGDPRTEIHHPFEGDLGLQKVARKELAHRIGFLACRAIFVELLRKLQNGFGSGTRGDRCGHEIESVPDLLDFPEEGAVPEPPEPSSGNELAIERTGGQEGESIPHLRQVAVQEIHLEPTVKRGLIRYLDQVVTVRGSGTPQPGDLDENGPVLDHGILENQDPRGVTRREKPMIDDLALDVARALEGAPFGDDERLAGVPWSFRRDPQGPTFLVRVPGTRRHRRPGRDQVRVLGTRIIGTSRVLEGSEDLHVVLTGDHFLGGGHDRSGALRSLENHQQFRVIRRKDWVGAQQDPRLEGLEGLEGLERLEYEGESATSLRRFGAQLPPPISPRGLPRELENDLKITDQP